MKNYERIVSMITLILAFFLFYSETNEWMGSLAAAILTAALTLGAMIILRWLTEVFTTNKK